MSVFNDVHRRISLICYSDKTLRYSLPWLYIIYTVQCTLYIHQIIAVSILVGILNGIRLQFGQSLKASNPVLVIDWTPLRSRYRDKRYRYYYGMYPHKLLTFVCSFFSDLLSYIQYNKWHRYLQLCLQKESMVYKSYVTWYFFGRI